MQFLNPNWWTFHVWSVAAGIAVVIGVVSVIADHRRQKRTRIDDVGFMPWTGITVIAFVIALGSILLAIKGY